MARKPRFNLPGVPQHVIQRGNNRENCFFTNDDYRRYLRYLRDAAIENHTAIHAYVLMTNHVHILATPGREFGISHMMQDLGRRYVPYINRTYQRTGTLWSGRYKASLIDSEAYLLTCMRYIELNPVRAGMSQHPGEYPWSSFTSNAQLAVSTFIEPHPVYQSLGKTVAERAMAYRNLFQNPISPNDVRDIRVSLNQELALGRKASKEQTS